MNEINIVTNEFVWDHDGELAALLHSYDDGFSHVLYITGPLIGRKLWLPAKQLTPINKGESWNLLVYFIDCFDNSFAIPNTD